MNHQNPSQLKIGHGFLIVFRHLNNELNGFVADGGLGRPVEDFEGEACLLELMHEGGGVGLANDR